MDSSIVRGFIEEMKETSIRCNNSLESLPSYVISLIYRNRRRILTYIFPSTYKSKPRYAFAQDVRYYKIIPLQSLSSPSSDIESRPDVLEDLPGDIAQPCPHALVQIICPGSQ